MSSGFRYSKVPNGVTMTSIVHQRIHQGLLFNADVYDAAVGTASTLELLIQTNDAAMHAGYDAVSGAEGVLELFEDTTFSAAGTIVPAVNRNRFKADEFSASSSLTTGPTIDTVGTRLEVHSVPGGSTGNAQGGDGETFLEWVLKPNTVYLLRMTNNGAQTVQQSIHLNFYEAPGGFAL